MSKLVPPISEIPLGLGLLIDLYGEVFCTKNNFKVKYLNKKN
jgi:hypothetical protein